jgi:hypothetical protein
VLVNSYGCLRSHLNVPGGQPLSLPTAPTESTTSTSTASTTTATSGLSLDDLYKLIGVAAAVIVGVVGLVATVVGAVCCGRCCCFTFDRRSNAHAGSKAHAAYAYSAAPNSKFNQF